MISEISAPTGFPEKRCSSKLIVSLVNQNKYGPILILFLLMLYAPVNNFSVMLGRCSVFLGWTSTKQQIMDLAQGHNTVTLPGVNLKLATLQYPV